MSDCGYSKGNMCGGCLHHKNAHLLQAGMYYCSNCRKLCEPEDYHKQHSAGRILINHSLKVRYEMPAGGNGKAKPIPQAPKELTGV